MTRAFIIVGPTATGKSELAADVAREVSAEIVSADAFQIYRGLDLLTAKPDVSTLANAPHHLIGTVPFTEAMNAEKFRRLGLRAIAEINSRGRLAIVVETTLGRSQLQCLIYAKDEAALKNAPSREDGYFKVKAIQE